MTWPAVHQRGGGTWTAAATAPVQQEQEPDTRGWLSLAHWPPPPGPPPAGRFECGAGLSWYELSRVESSRVGFGSVSKVSVPRTRHQRRLLSFPSSILSSTGQTTSPPRSEPASLHAHTFLSIPHNDASATQIVHQSSKLPLKPLTR